MGGMDFALTFLTGAVLPCVFWWLDRRRYAITLAVKVWRIREGNGRGLLRVKIVNHSFRDVSIEAIQMRADGEKDYVGLDGVVLMPESLAPGTAQACYVNPGAREMDALESQPGIRVLTACERVFQARWVDDVAND
jgi:hypothetical protein